MVGNIIIKWEGEGGLKSDVLMLRLGNVVLLNLKGEINDYYSMIENGLLRKGVRILWF